MSSSSFTATFESKNLVLVFANVFVFMVIQTLFFDQVASRQFDDLLKNKTGIYTTWLRLEPSRKEQARARIDAAVDSIRGPAAEQAARRNAANWSLFRKDVGLPLALVVAILAGLVVSMRRKGTPWTSLDTTMLTLVLGAYFTELLFFFGIVRRYEFYVDQKLYFNLLRETRKQVF